ncbi:hypothetical protein [Desulfobacter latus]|uniref:Uncharacterized protein n=1 Tax=Desulfobacter latus TaxID=2292 RepID=A0A850TDR1_9BACT|nr:hypothetical protein [Desulfobacter latus]NWH05576.1 hypothetical protein [Desulfobacter latus]
MRTYRQKRHPRMPIIALAVVIATVLVVIWIVMDRPPDDNRRTEKQKMQVTQDKSGVPKTDSLPGVVVKQISKPTVIDYNKLAKEGTLKDLMASRKKDLGVKNSVDIVVKPNESFTVGGNTVSMEKVLEQAFAGKGKVFEKELDQSGAQKPVGGTSYGVYVVQPRDNIWNIHFRILKEYYIHKGVRLEENADEPAISGMSSGVGKILKFSETMVIIYNLKEKEVTEDINTIDPLSKVVIYNMDEIIALLEQIDLNHVDKLRFDGSNIWIPVH